MTEQIKKHELAESIYMSGHGLDRKDCADIAEQLYHESYCKQSDLTPCDVCRFNPPSSTDGKPCSVCPAQAKGGAT